MKSSSLIALAGAIILTGCANHRDTIDRFADTDTRFGQMTARDKQIEGSVAQLDATQKRDIARVDGTLKSEIARVDGTLRSEIARVDGTLKSEIARVDGTLRSEVARVEGNLKREIARVDDTQRRDVTRLDADIKETLRIAKGKFAYATAGNQTEVLFASGSAKVGKDDLLLLETLAKELLRANKNVYVEIRGYTDAAGTERQNQSLALARAEAVRAVLSESGVALHRISVIALPERVDSAKQSAEERARSRRVTISIVE